MAVKRAKSGSGGAPRRPAKHAIKPGASRSAGARGRIAARRRLSNLPDLPGSWRARLAVLGLLAVATAAGYAFWLRDSPLVAVERVAVEGLASPDSEAIATALRRSAEGMTTLNLDSAELEASVEGFPSVRSIALDAHLPNGLTIEVEEAPPTMIARSGEQQVPVAADGELLYGATTEGLELPGVELTDLPDAGKLTDAALEQALVVGAAPEPLRPLIQSVGYSTGEGVQIGLAGGVELEFGASSDAAAKWAAAAAVLADGRLETLAYIDLRVPTRPAVG